MRSFTASGIISDSVRDCRSNSWEISVVNYRMKLTQKMIKNEKKKSKLGSLKLLKNKIKLIIIVVFSLVILVVKITSCKDKLVKVFLFIL